MDITRWTVGAVTITRVLEAETPGVPPEFFFPEATAEDVRRHGWLVPDFAAADGTITFAVQAFVLDVGGRRIVVDPCVGNGKQLTLPFWNDQDWPFWERFEAAGFTPESVDLVVHTHLHEDHIGWGTRRVDGEWRPTFTNARYLYNELELEHRRASDRERGDAAYAESIEPVFAAGLADVVDVEIDLGDGLRFESSPGHTPGHVSLWIESEGETALVTGDFLHHPVQCAEPHLAEIADVDADLGRETRRRMMAAAVERDALFVGTHFPNAPAGRVVAEGDAFRFVPLR
jgi:glyoxylase-like metal-dependent hydrolase (beta-lactamase superfamily II)